MRYKIVERHNRTYQLLRDGCVLQRTLNIEKIGKGQPTQIELEFWSEIKRLRAVLAIQQKEEQMSSVEQVREQIIEHQEQRRQIKELEDRKSEPKKATMVIWVRKDAVRAQTNQRAIVLGIDKHCDIEIKLLGDDLLFTIKPKDVIGIEVEEMILQFNYVCYSIRRK